jgi:asparagine synthase (glutamine-hydrolysing)
MCGIAGVYSWRGDVAIDESVIIAMRDSMAHRGPDDAGVFVHQGRNVRIGLGHRRLSILDLSARGHQPMSSNNEQSWIVFNGEIFNFKELRTALEHTGRHRFRTETDTEVILHAIQEWGLEAALNRFRGMYAFALFNVREETLTLVRDPLGVKPLYYREDRGSLIFASEIKAILMHPAVERKLDARALCYYLTFANTPAPLTLFDGIGKLEAGCYMRIDASGAKEYRRYWDPTRIVAKPQLQEGECIEEIRRLLRQAVARRMVSDVPVGVFLSGGVDSSLNVALMAEQMNRPVETYSIGIREGGANEFEYARAVAHSFATNHHEIQIGHEDFINFLDRMAYVQDEPLADPVCVPLYYLSKLARETGTPVIQVGEGSDEIFGGYAMYHRFDSWNRIAFHPYSRLPGFAKNALYRVSGHLRQPAIHDAGRRAAQGDPLFIGNAVAFWDSEKELLLKEPPPSQWYASRLIREMSDSFGISDPLVHIANVELKNRLPELLLMRVDKITMANSIEARVPFLDEDLVEFALTIPASLKFRNGIAKYVLKKAAEGLIPNKLIYRKKMGFCGSATTMLTNALATYAQDVVMDSEIIKDLFQRAYIEKIFRQHRTQPRFNGFKIWNLLNLALWHNTWFGAKRTAAVA